MYKMLKYDQSYEEIEEQDEAKINAKAKERENVVDPVNDYILRKKYTAKSLTSNKLKRKMIDKVIKHNKRSEKIKAKFQENEVVSTGTTEKLILSKDNKYEYEEQKLISLSESESSDTEYLLKVPHLNGSPNKKVVNSVPNTNSGEQEKTQRKLSSDSKSKETNQEKTKNKKTETPSPKSKVLNEKTKKKVEEVKEDSDSEIPELVPASIESSPKQAKKEAGLNNSKAQEKIKENSSTNKKLLNSDGQTTKSALQNKLDEDNDSFEEFSSDIDDEGEQEESDDYVEGEEDDDEDYDVGVENFNTRMNNLLKQKILLRSQGKLDYDDDYEDFEDDLEDLDYMDFDDLDMYFNKPAHEEEDEQDDDQVDSGKLNENLKLAFLRSQENLKINSNIKTKTFLGKKRAANALKDAKFKKKPASNESQNRNNSSKVSFKIGSNKFNGKYMSIKSRIQSKHAD